MTADGEARRGSLSFGAKLALSFVGLSLVVITMVGVILTTLNNNHAMTGLREKARLYARLLEPQLRTVVAFNDKLTAGEIFESFEADAEVAGLAVYTATGEPIAIYGSVPEALREGRPSGKVDGGLIVVLAPVVSPEGPRGTLYLGVTTRAVARYRDNNTVTALAIAVGALLLAIAFAWAISRAVTHRLRRISDAAKRVSDGDLSQPDVPPGAADEIGSLTRAFNAMVSELRRQFAQREQLAASEQARLEAIVATRTAQLEESREQYRLVAESTNAVPFTYEPGERRFVYVGPQAGKLLGYTPDRCTEAGFLEQLVPGDEVGAVRERLDSARAGDDFELECPALAADGRKLRLRWTLTCGDARGERCLRGLMLDITDQRRLEGELAQAQKLESVGRLASGIAHEINTPIQFIGDSVQFVREAATDLARLIETYQEALRSAAAGAPTAEALARATKMEESIDLQYLQDNVPRSLERALEGVSRVAAIVLAMKEFAHPDQREMTPVDLNQAISSTLAIARNEYKYVADVETEFGELPRVTCHPGEINQAILNVVVNAAHAIGDVVRDTDRKGLIRVCTRRDGEEVVVSISDTGGGIPEPIRERIFDPFFTTKEVGRGTGQGLAISRSVVREKHGGDLCFDTETGKGTTFFIRLPVNAAGQRSVAVA